MYDRGIAVVAITRHGVATALKIKEALENAGLTNFVYAPKKYSQTGVVPLETKFADFVKDNYGVVDALVAVMATGIVVRSVAPYLESKLTDPAVISVDAAGKFVISLLSGHYGGANELTKIIAKGIGATAVITTASDATGKQSVDELAKNLHLTIQNPESLVGVNSAIVNEDKIVLVLVDDADIPIESIACYEVKRVDDEAAALEIINSYDAGIVVALQPLLTKKFVKPITVLKTKKIVVGLGARKDSSADSIIIAVETALKQVKLSLSSVTCFATVDIKRNSPAMVGAVRQFSLPLEFLSVDELRSLNREDLSPDSKMVQEKIGVGGVCERAALIVAGKNSKLILKKTKLNGVTVAIAEGE